MKLLILFASPRPRGNTVQLLEKITEVFDESVEITRFDLYGMDLKSCIACRRCQKVTDSFHCVHDDDMQEIFDAALESDLILFATPICSFYCTPPMKIVMDRLVYGMCKYYGETMGPLFGRAKPSPFFPPSAIRRKRPRICWSKGFGATQSTTN